MKHLSLVGSLFLASAALGCSLNTKVDGFSTERPDPTGLDAQNVDAAGMDSGRMDARGDGSRLPDVVVDIVRVPDATDGSPNPDGGEDAAVCIPADEVCNGRSDDCDEDIDEDGACGDSCFTIQRAGSIYLFCSDARNFEGARTSCGANGYRDLVVIEDEEEDMFVASTAFGVSEVDWWIGIHDPTNGTYERMDGTIIWQDGAVVSGRYNRWRDGVPQDSPSEECTELDVSGRGWADSDCAQNQPFVCETDRED